MSMQINGLFAEINLPDAPKGEGTYSLPPYKRQTTHKVDDYAGCPKNWMNGSSKAASFFLPVDTGKHLWLDFNSNWSHAHHIAIVMSIQGINPITGLPTKSLRLEQYRDKCIIHGDEFGADRFCQKCNDNVPGDYDGSPVTAFPSKWAPQNYMTTASHTRGELWIDGWMAEDDTIRGFLITSEMMKGVASQIIGEDRVWAIGIAFYLAKEPKPRPKPSGRVMRSHGISGQSVNCDLEATKGINEVFGASMDSSSYNTTLPQGQGMGYRGIDDMAKLRTAMSVPANADMEEHFVSTESLVETEKLEIGAGAKIKQKLCYLDPNDPDYYKDEPEGLIYINYCTQEDCAKILAAGKIDRTKGGEGFLSGLQTGN